MTDVIAAYGRVPLLESCLATLEDSVVASTGWPRWAVKTVLILFCVLGVVTGLQVMSEKGEASAAESSRSKGRGRSQADEKEKTSFFWFQLQYLSVYLIVMLADWLQGPNMYTLYTSYGVDVGTLFITGFLSSAIFGTFLGVYVDTWGRRLGCIVFCVLEIVINLLEHVPNFTTLMVGRVMGGISTSLLFSAFESWMVSEHRKRGYSEDWLSNTFALAASGNGIVAILAGFIAQISADIGGDIGPFQVAIALTVVALVLVLGWEENYGEPEEKQKPNKRNRCSSSRAGSDEGGGDGSGGVGGAFSSFYSSIARAFSVCVGSGPIMCLGLSQAIFEGAVYTFVFMWVKVLGMLQTDSSLHTGLVMTCFMLAMTIGGSASSWLLPSFPGGAHGLTLAIYIVAAAAMMVPVLHFSFPPVFAAFLVLEATVGVFNACGGTLRSRYYPEAQQSTIMTVFRIPLNSLVVLGTYLSDSAQDEAGMRTVFVCITSLHLLAAAMQVGLGQIAGSVAGGKDKGE